MIGKITASTGRASTGRGLIWVPYEVSLGLFLLILYHIASKKQLTGLFKRGSEYSGTFSISVL